MKNFFILLSIIIVLIVIQLIFGSASLIPFAVAFSLSSVAIGIWLSLQQYSLKLKSEKVETDVKLVTIFTKIMNIAHARSGYVVSEKAIEKIFDSGILTESEIRNASALNDRLEESAILTIPVGIAEQDAAIVAIAKLGSRHEVLKDIAIVGLNSIKSFKPELANKYLKELVD